MKHVFFIDDLSQLNIKKDSSLLLADTCKEVGHECYFLFEKDFSFSNACENAFHAYPFEIQRENDQIYLKSCQLEDSVTLQWDKDTIVHMRLDPPFDSRYLRYLWMLDFIKPKVARVINDPQGIMHNNEKLIAFTSSITGPESYVGASMLGFQNFLKWCQKKGISELIMKPMDSFSGYGVEKVPLDDKVYSKFTEQVQSVQGPLIVQPFYPQVYDGEHRVVMYQTEHIGTIVKVPPAGEFLSNIAQGASFEKSDVSSQVMKRCQEMSCQLKGEGVYLVAYDILGERITEVNVTCPGLLVELSKAYGENLCIPIAKALR